MRFEYDMSVRPAAERTTLFRSMVARTLDTSQESIDYRFVDEDFVAHVRGRRVGSFTFAESITSRYAFTMDRRQANAATHESLLLVFNLDQTLGSLQDDHETQIGAGELGFVSKGRPFREGSGGTGRRVYLQLPKSDLTVRLGPVDDLVATSFPSTLPVQRLAMRFFADLAAESDRLEDQLLERLIGQGLDILALAISEQVGASLANTTAHRSAMLLRLKAAIQSRIKDTDLSIASIATELGISKRYVASLLATQSTTFGRFVMEQRLQGCRRDLANPIQVSRQIIDIAFTWGFADPAHFSRSFRARFGCSPREYRHR